jgi:hypothetical protein
VSEPGDRRRPLTFHPGADMSRESPRARATRRRDRLHSELPLRTRLHTRVRPWQDWTPAWSVYEHVWLPRPVVVYPSIVLDRTYRLRVPGLRTVASVWEFSSPPMMDGLVHRVDR